MEEYFRFRYRIYSESRQVGFVATKGDGRDVDVFDERALHFGWYMNDTLAGCIRFVEPDESEDALPMLSYMNESGPSNAVKQFIAMRRRQGEPVVEASRFCLAPQHRGLRTAKEFVLAMLRAVHPFGIEHGLFDCDVKHAPFYRALGFELLEGAERWQVPFLDYPTAALHYDLRRMIVSHPSLLAGQGVPQQALQDGGKKAA
ncbi:MAG: GNAT family N-acetyltransferase [Flavobacteriales bacterium]|nr:GNAT family N-acetyltransferase [Flavobacteriales bacterium]